MEEEFDISHVNRTGKKEIHLMSETVVTFTYLKMLAIPQAVLFTKSEAVKCEKLKNNQYPLYKDRVTANH